MVTSFSRMFPWMSYEDRMSLIRECFISAMEDDFYTPWELI